MKLLELTHGFHISYQEIGDAASTSKVIFVPGIMGNQKNLLSFATSLCRTCPETSALVLDVRNHGQSSKHWEPFTVEAAANDIGQLVTKLCLRPKAIVGHSFGGKVALLAAKKISSIEQVWMLDCPPGPILKKNPITDRSSMTALEILDVLSTINWPMSSRKEVVEVLLSRGVSNSIALWMTTNLEPHERGGLSLAFEPKEIKAMLEDFLSLDCWSSIEATSKKAVIHLLAAEHGDRLTKEDRERLFASTSAGQAYFHVLNNSGHFVHRDNLDGLMAIMAPFFA